MSDDKRDEPADKISISGSEDKSEAAKHIGRFAKYTAPAMLALLASGGFNKAFAQLSQA
jgi:hypothetical protein